MERLLCFNNCEFLFILFYFIFINGFVALTEFYTQLDYVHFGTFDFCSTVNKPLFHFWFDVWNWKPEQ